MSALAAAGSLAPATTAAEKIVDLLQFGRQWSQEIDPGDRFQLAYLLKTNLGFAACDYRANRFGWNHPAFGGDLIGNAQTLKQLSRNIHPAGAVCNRQLTWPPRGFASTRQRS